MDYEDIIANIIDEAFMDCEAEFEREGLDADFVSAFEFKVDENLTVLDSNKDVDIEHVKRLAKRCREIFSSRIDDAVEIAKQRAFEALEEELESIGDEMLSEVEDHVQAVNF